MIGAVSAGGGHGLQLVFTAIGVLVAVAVALVVGLIIYRGRRKPGSRARTIIDAGFVAVPGVVAMIAGAVGLFLGIAYFFILFVYWLFYVIVASIWVSIVGGQVTYPAEFGEIAGLGFYYMGLGVLVFGLGVLYLVLVVFRTVRRAQKIAAGAVYTVTDLAPPPVATLPAPVEESVPVPEPTPPRTRTRKPPAKPARKRQA